MENITDTSSINTEQPDNSAEKKQWTSPKMDTWSSDLIENVPGMGLDGGVQTYF